METNHKQSTENFVKEVRRRHHSLSGRTPQKSWDQYYFKPFPYETQKEKTTGENGQFLLDCSSKSIKKPPTFSLQVVDLKVDPAGHDPATP